MVKQPTIVNATSHTPTIILLILNLVVTIALLAHVVYYIPSSIDAAAEKNNSSATGDSSIAKTVVSDGVGTIGLDSTNRVQFDLIQLAGKGETPDVLQTVTVTQQAFLDSLERFSTFRQRLEEKELIRRSEE